MIKTAVVYAGVFLACMTTFAYRAWSQPTKDFDIAFVVELQLINALVSAITFVLCYPILVWRAQSSLNNKPVLQPLLVVALYAALLTVSNVAYFPVVSEANRAISSALPPGHFGFSDVFVMSAFTIMLSVVLVRTAGLAMSATHKGGTPA